MTIHEAIALDFKRIQSVHIPALVPIEAEAYPDPWSEGMFQQECTNHNSYFYVAHHGEQLVGYGGFWLLMDEAHITKITVDKPFRRQGMGLQIMHHLIAEAEAAGAKTMRLEVRQSNSAAQALYEELEFRVVGVRKGYYARCCEDAVVMVRQLEPTT